MAIPQLIAPHKGMSLDLSEFFVDQEHAAYIKNLDYDVDDNPRSSGEELASRGVFKPLRSNTPYCPLGLPEGDNYCIGYHYAREINHAFVFGWNSESDHFIYRIDGNTGQCRLVIINPCLNFQLFPRHFIGEGRVSVFVTRRLNKATGTEEQVSFIAFTDLYNDHRFFCVEDAIATSGFSGVIFPYFNLPPCNVCDLISLGIPTPGCPNVIAESQVDDEEKQNLLLFKGWQFRVRGIDVWGRDTEYGDPSNFSFVAVGNSCISNSSGLPRCFKLIIPAGCPTIDKIEVAFRNCIGTKKGFSITNDWQQHDTINKYEDCDHNAWWARELRADLNYDPVNNTIEYLFCANKECQPIAKELTNRNQNPISKTSSTLFPINNGIGLGRNTHGFFPLDCKELEKLNFTVTPPPPSSSCSETITRKVEIFAVLYTPFDDRVVEIRKKDGQIVFGSADCPKNNPFAYDQVFPTDQAGFVGYFAGTKNYCVSKQYVYDRNTQQLTLIELDTTKIEYFLNPGRYVFLQKFEMNVLPGRYIFRISSHKTKPTDLYEKTSTYMIGQTLLTAPGVLLSERKELIVDTTVADFLQLNNPIMIYDLTRSGKNCGDATSVNAGYIREDEVNREPIEMAAITVNTADFNVHPGFTDYNGFYFAAARARGLQTTLKGYKNCVVNQELAKSRSSLDQADSWYRFDELYAYKGTNLYLNKDRFIVKGRVALCTDLAIGISGVLVNLTNGLYAFTDADGAYRIVAHDIGSGGVRNESVIFSQRGNCQLLNCIGTCNYSLGSASISSTACGPDPREVNVPVQQVNIRGLNRKGPAMGGRYGGGIVMRDRLKRESFVQGLDKHYFDIPSLQETGVFDFSTIGWNVPADFRLPIEITDIGFYFTENLNFDDYLTWVAERIQFIDSTGNTNTATPTQIRLYYEGLGEYNKQHNYSTTATWQFLTADNESEQGDIVEFLVNGDGVMYTKKITALARYDKDGKYVQVEYSDDLRTLKDGALIKLIRQKKCEQKEFYYSVCPWIKVVNGIPAITSGSIALFDSYLVSRQIPVPVEVKKTSTDAQGNEIETSVIENQLRSYPYLFEHHSPSDFWGFKCSNRGRVNVKNAYESQVLLKSEIALSGKLSNGGYLNSLHHFDESNVVSFPEQEWGGITLALVELNQCLVINERDNFVVSFNDNQVRVNSQGEVIAPSAENAFGKPMRKIGANFGCDLLDVNTIRKKSGIVMFLDRLKVALVQHNYEDAIDVSEIAGFKGWLSDKVKHVIDFNGNTPGYKYFHAGFDPKKSRYYLTIAKLQQVDGQYANDSEEPAPDLLETIAYDPLRRELRLFAGFIPEYYGALEGDINAQQLFTFKKGAAWYHYKNNDVPHTYNNFFGIQTDKYMTLVGNISPDTVKGFQNIAVYSNPLLLFSDQIDTESGQVSRLMPLWFDRRDKFWVADFKCDLNTQADANLPLETGANALLDGELLRGRWIKVRLKGKLGERDKYFELTGVTIFMNAVGKSGR